MNRTLWALNRFRARKPQGSGRKYHTVTDIVATVYCEQKLVYDRERGKATPVDVRKQAVIGSFEHYRFQIEGQSRAVVDKRCYIATAIYGAEAPETQLLRTWRDRVLMTSWLGRMVVHCYYGLSPYLVQAFVHSAYVTRVVRGALDHLVANLSRPG